MGIFGKYFYVDDVDEICIGIFANMRIIPTNRIFPHTHGQLAIPTQYPYWSHLFELKLSVAENKKGVTTCDLHIWCTKIIARKFDIELTKYQELVRQK